MWAGRACPHRSPALSVRARGLWKSRLGKLLVKVLSAPRRDISGVHAVASVFGVREGVAAEQVRELVVTALNDSDSESAVRGGGGHWKHDPIRS